MIRIIYTKDASQEFYEYYIKGIFLKTEEEKSPEKAIRELNKLVEKTYNHIINKMIILLIMSLTK